MDMKAKEKTVGYVLGLLIAGLPLFLPAAQEGPKLPTDDLVLNGALESAARYCQKLKNFLYNFVCHEEVEETIRGVVTTRWARAIKDLEPTFAEMEGSAPSVTDSTQKNTYLYDYQVIRKRGIDQESRTLLEKNGQKTAEKNARLEAMKFYFPNMAFGPIDLFGENGRRKHNYRILDTIRMDGQEVLVIEAAPKDDSLAYNPSGKIWLRKADGAILKIEWDKRSLFGFKDVQALAEGHGLVPILTLLSEYGVEKDGLRFPSRVYFEEAYFRKRARKTQVVSKVTIKYKDYKFLLVEGGLQFKQ